MQVGAVNTGTMTARISHDATLIRLAAGEPICLQYQSLDILGAPESLTSRKFNLVIYTTAGAALFTQAGVVFGDTQGDVIEFLVPGNVTAKLKGTNLRLEIAELMQGGKHSVVSAQLVIDPLVPGQEGNTTKGIQLINRIKRRFDVMMTPPEVIDVDVLRYVPDANGTYSLYTQLDEVTAALSSTGA